MEEEEDGRMPLIDGILLAERHVVCVQRDGDVVRVTLVTGKELAFIGPEATAMWHRFGEYHRDAMQLYRCSLGQHVYLSDQDHTCDCCHTYDEVRGAVIAQARIDAKRAAGTLTLDEDPESPTWIPF